MQMSRGAGALRHVSQLGLQPAENEGPRERGPAPSHCGSTPLERGVLSRRRSAVPAIDIDTGDTRRPRKRSLFLRPC